jgi:hypothetical protein
MKTIVLMFAMLVLVFQGSSYAQMVPVDYSGNSAYRDADETFLSPGSPSGLGGPNGNDETVYKTTQFTVSSPTELSYLYISAEQFAEPRYFGDPLPNYSQSMDVTFSLIDGTQLSNWSNALVPSGPTLASSTMNFSTIIGQNVTDYSGILLPFQADLNTNDTYWISASTTGGEGSALDYYTAFIDAPSVAPVPEPATIWLFLVAAIGFVMLKRKQLPLWRLA